VTHFTPKHGRINLIMIWPKLLLCTNQRPPWQASCAGSGAREWLEPLRQALAERGWAVSVEEVCCFGWCKDGPNLRIEGGPVFHRFSRQQLPLLLEALEQQLLKS
jgi:NADH:ubiquinone oxidoreductase subunit E